MTTLDPLTEPLVRLFLRIDAAGPSDELLCQVWKFWASRRLDMVAPSEDIMTDLTDDLRPYVFEVHLSRNGALHWLATRPGRVVEELLSVKDQSAIDKADKRCAVRLRRLFDLVSEKKEPYSAMFETKTNNGKTLLIEVVAAPLLAKKQDSRVLLVAANSRVEQL